MNFYYGNIADFISKIISIDKISLTENSLKLNGLEHLQPFNKIKKIYVDPCITKEKNLINRLMSENCNFDKKLNIYSNSEYVDYSMFTNLEKINIKFSSKVAQMFNISLSGNKLIELYIEDVNEDYQMNFYEKNKFDFNFTKNKKDGKIKSISNVGVHNVLANLKNCNHIKNNSEVNYLTSAKSDNNNVIENAGKKETNINNDLIRNNSSSITNYLPISRSEKLKLNGFNKPNTFNESSVKAKSKNNFFRFNGKNSINKNSTNESNSKTKSLNFSPKQTNKKQINILNNYNHKKSENYFDVLVQNINIHEKYNSFASLKYLKFTNCLLNSKFKISHCSNLKELYFDDCLFQKAPFDYFCSIEKLTFKTCFQRISLEDINSIAEKYKNLNTFSLINPTDEFLETIIKSNIFFNLKNLTLKRINQENYDELFKLVLKTNAFEKLIFFPDYKHCTDMLLLIKFLDFTLKYNNKLESLEFLVGINFHNANIDRVKFFLRKLKYLRTIRFYMPKSEEAQWKLLFKDFNNVDWTIETETPEKDILSYFLNE